MKGTAWCSCALLATPISVAMGIEIGLSFVASAAIAIGSVTVGVVTDRLAHLLRSALHARRTKRRRARRHAERPRFLARGRAPAKNKAPPSLGIAKAWFEGDVRAICDKIEESAGNG